MENITILVNKKTRQVNLTKSVIGNDGENLQENLVFAFNDEFVDGTGRLEINYNNQKSYIMLTKTNETYQLPIKSVITKGGRITMQLVITEGTNDEEIPIFKSNEFYMIVNSSINAEIEQPDEYAEWIDVANTKLNEFDNLDISASKSGTTTTVTITNKEGQQTSVEILDGEKGEDGQPGTNGQNGITPTIGDNGNWYLGSIDTGKPSRGIQGETGATGQNGQNGTNGVDGISPTVTTSKSGNATTITITDKNGDHTATILDGTNGTNGSDGRDGYVQYTAGDNITIANNVISAIGGENIEWLTATYNEPYILSEMTKGNYYPLGLGYYKDTSSSTRYDYLYTEDYGNYCHPYVLILNKDVSEASANENIGYAIFVMSSDRLFSGLFIKSGDVVIAPIRKVNSTIRIKTFVYGEWNVIGQTLNELAQSIKGIKTFYSIPKVSSYTAPTQDTELTAKKYVDDKIGDINTILATLTTPSNNS